MDPQQPPGDILTLDPAPPPEMDEDEADAQVTAIDVPDDTGEGGKLRMIVQLVKRSFGVKDLAAMRLSLPASLLEPIPNLEYWHYLDRPDLFVTINDHEDTLERMLAVLRFTFSKDIKHLRGKPCKPYNSVLGENFRMHWDVTPISYDPDDRTPIITAHVDSPPKTELAHSEATGVSNKGGKSPLKSGRVGAIGSLLSMKGWSSPAIDKTSPTTVVESNASAQLSNLSLASTTHTAESGSGSTNSPPTSMSTTAGGGMPRLAYLTEQISHHPPISAYVAACPARHITLSGIDQITVRVLPSTSLRVSSGAMNKGLFISLDGGHGAGERYQITHPVAHVNGVLRGSFYATVHESTIITCTGGSGVGDGEFLRAIVEYKEESWLGKPHFLVEGVIHRYKPSSHEHEEWTKVKHVPPAHVEVYFEGCWRNVVRWRHASTSTRAAATTGSSASGRISSSSSSTSSSSSPAVASAKASKGGRKSDEDEEWTTLIDLVPLRSVPKMVRPISKQHPTESRRLWESVTSGLLRKEFGEATRAKHIIEQRQRDEAAERKRRGVEFVPKFFEMDIQSGVPTLTRAGRVALEAELKYEDEVADADADADAAERHDDDDGGGGSAPSLAS